MRFTTARSDEGQDRKPSEIDLIHVRQDFPLLRMQASDRPLVYLDSAATTQKPEAMLKAMAHYYERACSNVHRGLYDLAEEATALYEQARDQVARFVGAPDRRGVVFTRGCTEAINLVAHSFARRELKPGHDILTSALEHHSNLVPWQQAARDCGATLRHLPLLPDGGLDMGALPRVLTPRTRLVCVSGLSNVTGAVTDLGPIVQAAHEVGALVLVDAAQLVLHRPIDMTGLGVDFLAFSGHKVLGPTGVGVLAARPELLERMEPFLTGGEMVLDVTLQTARWNDIPHKFEAGTPPVAEAIGLGAALGYLQAIGWDRLLAHDLALTRLGLEVLSNIPGLRLYGPPNEIGRVATLSFNLYGRRGELIHPHDLCTWLARDGIAVRGGHQCAKPLMRHFGVPAMTRASAALYNTQEDLSQLARSLIRAREYFAP